MTAALAGRASPYQGLVPYQEGDADWFFGREADTRILTGNLEASRLSVVYGPSGSGKTSVLRAGVEHTVNAEARWRVAAGQVPGSLVVVVDRWDGADPRAEVVASVAAGFRSVLPAFVPSTLGGPLADRLRSWIDDTGSELLLVLDQFEEYFLYHEHGPAGTPFASELARLVRDPALAVNVMLSLRDDRLSELDRLTGLIPTVLRNLIRVGPLDTAAARAAITGPIDRYNEVTGENVEIERELVDEVIHDVAIVDPALRLTPQGEATARRDEVEAPLLQLVMTRVWEAERGRGSNVLRLRTLEDLGGAARISGAHLDHTLRGLTAEQAAVAAEIFDRLVTPSGSKIAQRASDLEEYYARQHAGTRSGNVTGLLEELASQRIVRSLPGPSGSEHDRRYVLFHDVLATPLLLWLEFKAGQITEARKRDHLARRLALTSVALATAAVLALILNLHEPDDRLTLIRFGLSIFAVASGGAAMWAARRARRIFVPGRRRLRWAMAAGWLGVLVGLPASSFLSTPDELRCVVAFEPGDTSVLASYAGADLAGCNLSTLDLRSIDLETADLRDALLREADLEGANLARANLRAADLSGADLDRANLADAILIDAILRDASLVGADLRGVNLNQADFTGADLSFADLSGAVGFITGEGVVFSETVCPDGVVRDRGC